MTDFINRAEELSFLRGEYDKSEASLVVLYGRRRMGKTSLISEFGKDKNMMYFLATDEPEGTTRRRFKDFVLKYTGDESLKNKATEDWPVIFDALSRCETEQKKLIVLDEFQYIGKNNPSFLSIFKNAWTELKKQNVMLILCGSMISLIEAQTLSNGSHLRGQVTAQKKIAPVFFQHYHEFFHGQSRNELIEYYSVTGGIPRYIELFRDEPDLWTAIEKHVLSKKGFLYEEPTLIARSEVQNAGNYVSLIRAIVDGKQQLDDIAAATGIKKTSLTKYIRKLINMDVLIREVPITKGNPARSKPGLYRIKDRFLEFWLKFIYPKRNLIETGRTQQLLEDIRNEFIDRHVAYVYEDVCRQRLWQFEADGWLSCNFDRIGRWWDSRRKIDIVALDSKGTDIVFCECRYTGNPMDTDVYEKLLEKKYYVQWNNSSRQEYFIFFSKNGYTQQMKDLAVGKPNVLLYE